MIKSKALYSHIVGKEAKFRINSEPHSLKLCCCCKHKNVFVMCLTMMLIVYSARAWAEASKVPDLTNKSIEQLSHLFLCAEHFEEKCFTNPTEKHTLIRWKEVYPIPTRFKHNIPLQVNQIIFYSISFYFNVFMGNIFSFFRGVDN